MNHYGLVIVTASTKEEAEKLIGVLLEKKLAACIQTYPISSSYTWKGKVQNDAEYILIIKTRGVLFTQIEETIKANHSYKTPEIIQIPIEKGSTEYFNWIDEVT